jgi:hypothetical protein
MICFIKVPTKASPSDEVRPRGGGCRCCGLATGHHSYCSYGLRAAKTSNFDERELRSDKQSLYRLHRQSAWGSFSCENSKTVLPNVAGTIKRKDIPTWKQSSKLYCSMRRYMHLSTGLTMAAPCYLSLSASIQMVHMASRTTSTPYQNEGNQSPTTHHHSQHHCFELIYRTSWPGREVDCCYRTRYQNDSFHVLRLLPAVSRKCPGCCGDSDYDH